MTERAPLGRPTDYTPDLGERILALMTEGLSLAAAAAECDVHRQRVYDWERKHPDFADTIRLGRSKRQLFLERKLLAAKEGPVATSAIFALKNAAAEDWRDVKAVEHTGRDGGPIETKAIDYSDAPDEVVRWLARQREDHESTQH